MRAQMAIFALFLVGLAMLTAPVALAFNPNGWPNSDATLTKKTVIGGHKATCQVWIFDNGYITRCWWAAKKTDPSKAMFWNPEPVAKRAPR